MKKINYLYIGMVLSCGALFTACSDDDDLGAKNITVEEAYNIESDVFGIDVTEGEPLQLKPFIMPESARDSKVSYRFAGEPSGAIDLSEDGLITPLLTTPPAPEPIPMPLGTDTIIVSVEDGSGTYVVYPVRVISNIVVVSSITIQSAGQTVEAEKGATFNLAQYVTVNPSDATDPSVTYTSDDESVATVDQNGIITITGEIGQSTTVRVTANDRGKAEAVCTVKVADEAPLYVGVPYDASTWAFESNLANYMDGSKECVPENMFDDDNSTYYAPNISQRPTYDPQAYLDIDFGKVIKFGQIGWRHRSLNYQWLQVHTFTLQGKLAADDEWTDLGTFETEALKADDYQLFQIETPMEIQYLRINFIKGHLRDGASWDDPASQESGTGFVGDLQIYEYNR